MLKEFRDFAMRGNVIDLAVGVVIGVAFGAIVDSLVNDIIMPPVGLLLGGVDFSDIFINLSGTDYPSLEAARSAGAPVIAIGSFINTILHFLIIAFAIFILVKQINRLRGPAPAPEVTTKECPACATTIPIKARRCPNCTSELYV